MKFDQIDEEVVTEQTLEQDATEYETRAIMLEYEAMRLGTVSGVTKSQQRLSKLAADDAREEADAFIKAADFTDDKVGEIKLNAVNGLISNIETQFVQAKVRSSVRARAGLATASHDNQMADLEKLKRAVESSMLAPLVGNREQKRAAKRTTAKKAAAPKSAATQE